MFLITVISSIFFQQLGSEAIFPAANLLFLSLSDAIDSYEMPSQILEFHHVCEATIAPSKTDNFMANNLVFRWPKTLSFHGFGGAHGIQTAQNVAFLVLPHNKFLQKAPIRQSVTLNPCTRNHRSGTRGSAKLHG